MRKIVFAWMSGFAFVAGCGGSGSGGDEKQPGFEGKNPTGSTSKFTSFAVAASGDLPSCIDEIEGSLAYLKSEKKFRVCADGTWSDTDIKGEPGEDGAQGPKGDAGAQGPKGDTGEPGQDGTTKITATIFCSGDLSTLSDGARTLNGKTISPDRIVQYDSATFSNGDTFATARVKYPDFQVSGTNLYASSQNGAATAAVIVSSDDVSPSNFGFWTVSVNRSSGVATVRYTDYDFGLEPNYLEWNFAPSACTIQNW